MLVECVCTYNTLWKANGEKRFQSEATNLDLGPFPGNEPAALAIRRLATGWPTFLTEIGQKTYFLILKYLQNFEPSKNVKCAFKMSSLLGVPLISPCTHDN